MSDRGWWGMAVVLSSLVGVPTVEAQSLFQRFAQQLSPQPAPTPPAERLPAVPPAATPALPAPGGNVSGPVEWRPSLGVRVGPITEEVIRAQRLAVRQGAVIQAIESGSPAERAGLPLGAVIVSINGRRIDSPDELVHAVQALQPGQNADITYYDQNRLTRKAIQLGAVAAPPTNPPAASPPVAAGPNAAVPPAASATPPRTLPPANLEREFGGDGSRPLLGRIGRALDTITAPITPSPNGAAPNGSPYGVAPAQAVVPITPGPTPAVEGEVRELRQQVSALTRQIEALQKQVQSLEQKLSERP